VAKERAAALSLRVAAFLILALAAAMPGHAKDRTASIVIRAGKSDSVNHALAVEFAGAMATGANGAYTLDVQESQGSIANVIDAAKAPANYLFTAGPNVIAAARRGQKPFTPDPRYRSIRALFPIPGQTVQWVVLRTSPLRSLEDMPGRSFITGPSGGIAARVSQEALQALGIEREVQIMDINPAGGLPALAAGQVAAVAIAGPYPVPALAQFAAKTPIRLLSLPEPQLGKVLASDDSLAAEVVPRAAYGLEADAVTLALPAGVYTTTRMSEATAYALTKAFWAERAALVKRAAPWQAVDWDTLATLGAQFHKGALRFYREVKFPVPKALRG
jgi:TRAP transporter TAXI family solute receptor